MKIPIIDNWKHVSCVSSSCDLAIENRQKFANTLILVYCRNILHNTYYILLFNQRFNLPKIFYQAAFLLEPSDALIQQSLSRTNIKGEQAYLLREK